MEQFVFFDSAAVNAAIDRGAKRALSKFGAYVRTRARSSIRTRKRTSQPGQPPSNHTGHLKKLIFFGYDAQKKSVVVGPLVYHKSAARIIEYGGISEGALYRPRPFMRPAFEIELNKAARLFRDQIK